MPNPANVLGRPAHRLLSHPFRLAANGAAATVAQDTDASDAELIAVLALTVVGERPLVPGFGISDPTLAGIAPAELAAGVARFGPPVTIAAVDVAAEAQGQRVTIAYE